jgi:hypothetical protein
MISTLPASTVVSASTVLEASAGFCLIVLLVIKELIRAVINNAGKSELLCLLQTINHALYVILVPLFLGFLITILIKIFQVMS